MNKVQLIGRFTSDPEVKYTGQDGKTAVAHFSLAVDRRYKKEGDAEADFPRCVAFGKTAEFVEKYFRKGMKIGISGRLQTGSYEKDGVKRYTVEISADNVSFCGSKSETGTSGAPSATVSTAAPSFSNGGLDDFAAMADDDDFDLQDAIDEAFELHVTAKEALQDRREQRKKVKSSKDLRK